MILAGVMRPLINGDHIFSLQAFLALDDGELNFLTVLQRLMAIAADGTIVDENVLPAFATDKAKAFAVVEPLDSACFSFSQSFSFVKRTNSNRAHTGAPN